MQKPLKTVLLLLSVAILAGISCAITYVLHRRAIRSEILQAYGAVETVADYQGNTAFLEADLAARQRLIALESYGLNTKDEQIVKCVQEYLEAVESLNSSMSIEDTRLRQNIAVEAAEKAEKCIKDLR